MDEPPSRTQTARERLLIALREGFATIHDLSQRAGLSERQVLDHLPHVEKSLKHKGATLEREWPECLKCGHRFEDRERFGTPSRCPACRSERVSPPRYRVV